MINEVDAAYIAGLFDGEGTITYKQYMENKKGRDGKRYKSKCWRISMEIAMTDKSVLIWLHETLGCGTLRPKPRKEHKMQYRWRCVFRDAYHVCCVIWPFAHVKLDKITQIIEHYSTIARDNVIDMKTYKEMKEIRRT
jgi:hypothetical protein|tara:strand:+ start:251 stop:664 length:414 start_codon:yes stop_codon:yes gene_type:complete